MTSNRQKEIINIEGMTCANCALGIKRHLEKKGGKNVNVNFTTNSASLNVDENFKIQYAINLIEEIGYKATKNLKESHKEGISSIEKKFFFSLVFTVPLFMHMFLPEGSFLHNPIVQFLLCIPVYLIGILYFGKSAYVSLKSGIPNMNVLIFMGSSAAFFYSIYGWLLFAGTSTLYDYLFFETSATIITLVLLGNVLEHRSVKKTTSAISDLAAIKIGIAKMEVDGKIEKVSFDEINVGDIIIVNEGDKVPIDGTVIIGNASIDESMITGESISILKEVGDYVIGGTILNSGSIKIRAISVGNETLISQIIELVKNAEDDKPNIQRLGDKVSAIFVPVVLFISFVTFIISFYMIGVSLTDSLLRSIAVLVISCPCAMGLATPTAVMVGIGRAAKRGILIKGGKTLEKLASIKSIVFDKTGTITTGNFRINGIKILEGEDSFIRDMIFNLENHSSHPIAISITEHLQKEANPLSLTQIDEQKGIGISAIYQNDKYQIGSNRILLKETEEHDLYLLKNDEVIAYIDIEDDLKEDAHLVINDLKNMDIETVLLSGDKLKKCQYIKEKLHFSEVFAEQLPYQKLEKIEKMIVKYPTAMFGDGINDAPALAKATVGISICNATQIAIHSADIILLNKYKLGQLTNAIDIANHTLITIKQNLFWAFAYNIIAIPIAAMGFLNPMWGALFMAFSDVIVIGNSIRLRYKKIF